MPVVISRICSVYVCVCVRVRFVRICGEETDVYILILPRKAATTTMTTDRVINRPRWFGEAPFCFLKRKRRKIHQPLTGGGRRWMAARLSWKRKYKKKEKTFAPPSRKNETNTKRLTNVYRWCEVQDWRGGNHPSFRDFSRETVFRHHRFWSRNGVTFISSVYVPTFTI